MAFGPAWFRFGSPQVLNETKLAIILQPLPKTGGGRGSGQSQASGSGSQQPGSGDASASVPKAPSKGSLKRKRQAEAKQVAQAELARARAESSRASAAAKAAAAQKPGRGDGKAGKGAGKRAKGPPMPRELVGMAAVTRGGVNCCYAFNMSSGCSKALPGESCDKGLHGCMVPLADGTACGKPHCAAEH